MSDYFLSKRTNIREGWRRRNVEADNVRRNLLVLQNLWKNINVVFAGEY